VLSDLLPTITAIEQSALGAAARNTTWLYPLANLGHVLGAALLVGAIVALDAKLLRGTAQAGAVARAAIPVAAVGLVLQFVTGVVLFSAEAVALSRNPAFLLKMAVLVLGLANIALFHWWFGANLRQDKPLAGARPLAAVSLGSWVTVLLAGRAIAYL
jgi:hypothetical protein